MAMFLVRNGASVGRLTSRQNWLIEGGGAALRRQRKYAEMVQKLSDYLTKWM
jgi:hypothetical protein